MQITIKVDTVRRGMYDITPMINHELRKSCHINTGVCHLFCQHTSASLTICENQDPEVKRDMEVFLSELVIDGDDRFEHQAEGPDDMPAHIRTMLTNHNLTIPVINGQLGLGTWQSIYLYEHRTSPHCRSIVLTFIAS